MDEFVIVFLPVPLGLDVIKEEVWEKFSLQWLMCLFEGEALGPWNSWDEVLF